MGTISKPQEVEHLERLLKPLYLLYKLGGLKQKCLKKLNSIFEIQVSLFKLEHKQKVIN